MRHIEFVKEFRWVSSSQMKGHAEAKQTIDPLDCIHLGGKPLAIKAASNFRFLRSKGIIIRKTVDMLFGTWCIEHNIELLHNDKDFDQMATKLPLRVYV